MPRPIAHGLPVAAAESGAAPATDARRIEALGNSLRAIAGEAGEHLRHLERLFHRHLGASPRGCYQRLQMAQACDVVQGTMMGSSQVAEAVGVDSLSDFSKCNMDAHGIRPSEDRQRPVTTPGEPASRRRRFSFWPHFGGIPTCRRRLYNGLASDHTPATRRP
ncbi:MAG TPA: helix-turn-helix domain-containing protein [Alphaproteobacteria bacterium]|nr:helix-turn-helix domain-containing protein [Alphaproteobacteria bacterium]